MQNAESVLLVQELEVELVSQAGITEANGTSFF